MKTYKVACSGWIEVEVEAKNPEDAVEIIREEAPGASGELYDLEIDSVVEVQHA